MLAGKEGEAGMKEAIIQYNDDPDNDGNHMLISWKPLVRCKDCKKHDTYDCSITYLTTQKTPNDWYCADGERKEGR